MQIVAKINDAQVKALMAKLINNSYRTEPAMRRIEGLMLDSVEQNFESEGRPRGWKPWADATRDARQDRGTASGKILNEHGASGLKGSINGRHDNTSAIVGSNKIYANAHNQDGNWGGTRNLGKNNKVKIPARPFLVFQDADIIASRAILTRHLLQGS